MEYTKKKLAERDALATQIMSMAEAATKEDRSLSESENASIDSMKASMGDIDTELRRFKGFQDAVNNFTDLGDQVAAKRAEAKQQPEVETRSMGEAFIQSESYGQYPGRGTSSKMMFETRALPVHAHHDGRGAATEAAHRPVRAPRCHPTPRPHRQHPRVGQRC